MIRTPNTTNIKGAGYYAIVQNSVLQSIDYIPSGQTKSIYNLSPAQIPVMEYATAQVNTPGVIVLDPSTGTIAIHTVVKHTAGELAQRILIANVVLPAEEDWPTGSATNPAETWTGINFGRVIDLNNQFTHYASTRNADFKQTMRKAKDPSALDKQTIFSYVKYLNLPGFIPALWLGDLPKKLAAQIPHLLVDDSYPEEGTTGSLNYEEARALYHYFYPTQAEREARMPWFTNIIRLKGFTTLLNPTDQAEFIDDTGLINLDDVS